MQSGSALALLRDRKFLGLWLAVILSFLGHFVHVITCAWVMTDLTHSATMVALVQTFASLPMALLALVAGGFADVFDRRKVMLLAEAGMLVVSVVLVLLSWGDLHTPFSLLALIFLVSLGSTVLVPAWQVSLGDLVQRDHLPEAISLHTIGANIIKTIGPFVGGIVLAGLGATATFMLSTLGYLPALIALSRWKTAPREEGGQKLFKAVGEGLNYFRSTPRLFPVVERIFLFGLCSTAVLSLLPLVAKEQLAGDADVYGLLFGGYGLGAILCGLMMSALRRRFGMERVVTATIAFNAVALFLLAVSKQVPLALIASAISGGCWLLVLTLLNSTLQLASPRRLVGRMVSIFMTFTYLGIALGGWIWGSIAEHFGLSVALVSAAFAMFAIVPFSFWRKLPDITQPELPPVTSL